MAFEWKRDLPKVLARNPYVRALSMKVYFPSPRDIVVVGGSRPHHVTVANGRYFCDCTAAQFKTTCAHILAIDYLKQLKESEIMFQTNRGSATADRPQLVPLPRKTLYGGLLAGWWTTKKKNPKTNVEEDKLGIRVLVTHISGKNWEKLDDITEAVTLLSNSFFHNDKTGKESYLFTVLRSITGAKPETLLKMTDEQMVEAINSAVGSGVVFMAEAVEKNGDYIGNFADGGSFEPADPAFSKLAAAMQQKIEIGETEGDNSRRFIKSPKGKELPEGVTAREYLGAGNEPEIEEIPF